MSGKNQQGKMDVTQKNGTSTLFNAPLHKHSAESKTPSNLPSTINAGMCTSSNPIAAILTNSFLDFSTSNGTDLRKSGVGPGQRYCLEASSWKSAADKGIGEVPKVKLESTHESALKSVGLDTLKKWAAEQENQEHVIRPGQGKGGFVRESDQIGGKEPRA